MSGFDGTDSRLRCVVGRVAARLRLGLAHQCAVCRPFPQHRHFQRAFVAFIDILGFTERVRRISTKADFHNVARVLYVLKREAESFTQANERFVADVQMTAVSDSVIVSMPYDSKAAAYLVVALLHQLQYALIADEGHTLVRGYLAQGPVYHRDGILFGTGYLAAYDGESKSHGPPRVVLDAAIAAEAVRQTNSSQGDGRISVMEFLRQDVDGTYFIDYLKPVGRVATYPLLERRQEIQDIAAFAHAEIASQTDPRIQEKYRWLYAYVGATRSAFYR